MTNFQQRALSALAASAALLAAAGPVMAQERDWDGGRGSTHMPQLIGAGVPLLNRELRDTSRGRAFVMRNFDANDDGRINPREAEQANRAFAAIARPGRGRFDWSSRDRVVAV